MLSLAALPVSYVPTVTSLAPATRAAAPVMETVSDLKDLSKKLNPVVGYWNPLSFGDELTIWGGSQEETIAWFRHAEIKHGRVAMAAFVGFVIQSYGLHWPWNIMPGTPFAEIAAVGGPGDQWDALSFAAKTQIILFVGFLEIIGESSYAFEKDGTSHYLRGGRPGYYPSLRSEGVVPHPVPLNLFDPFGLQNSFTPERKEQALLAEINNGRFAMIGIMGMLAASKGLIVPGLDSLPIAEYGGEYMKPFMESDVAAVL